jgi:hypothetical protein
VNTEHTSKKRRGQSITVFSWFIVAYSKHLNVRNRVNTYEVSLLLDMENLDEFFESAGQNLQTNTKANTNSTNTQSSSQSKGEVNQNQNLNFTTSFTMNDPSKNINLYEFRMDNIQVNSIQITNDNVRLGIVSGISKQSTPDVKITTLSKIPTALSLIDKKVIVVTFANSCIFNNRNN